MMNYGRSLVAAVNEVFSKNDYSTHTRSTLDYYREWVDFNLGNLYHKFLVSVIDPNMDSWEIPMLTRGWSEYVMGLDVGVIVRRKAIICPLICNGFAYTRRTFDSIIKDFFRVTHSSDKISKVYLSGSTIKWYGGRGIILDSDFNPLLLITMRVRKAGPAESRYHFLYDGCVCRISPKVFINKDLLCRGIVNKLIPLLSDHGISTRLDWSYVPVGFQYTSGALGKISIIVDNHIDDFIYSPVPPKGDVIDNLHDCLDANLDDVLMDLLA